MRRVMCLLVIWLLAVGGCNSLCDPGHPSILCPSDLSNSCPSTDDGTGGDGAGDDGAGDDGTGGDGTGGDSSDEGPGGLGGATGATTDPGSTTDPGNTTDPGPTTDPDPGARRPPHVARRHRPHRWRGEHLGAAVSADCPATPSSPMTPPSFPAWTFLPTPPVITVPANAVALLTTRLRDICTAQGIGAGMKGILFSQACGLAFENWVLWMLQVKPNKTPIDSPERASHFVGGLPGAVIPDYVTDLKVAIAGSETVFTLHGSFIGEVKAVAGSLPPSYSQYQILGLVDVTRLSTAGSSTLPNHPPPELVFTTTGNTKISTLTTTQASVWGVAIWWQIVYEVPAMENDPNPDLCIDRAIPQNLDVYPPGVTVGTYRVNSTCTKLTSAPPNWATLIPGDPDPPTVDP